MSHNWIIKGLFVLKKWNYKYNYRGRSLRFENHKSLVDLCGLSRWTKRVSILIFDNNPKTDSKAQQAFCWGNHGNANFWISPEKYIIATLLYACQNNLKWFFRTIANQGYI